MNDEKASSTAYTVAQGLGITASKAAYKDLVPPEVIAANNQILNASTEGRKRLRQLNSKGFRFLASVLERLILPGIFVHYALRKRYIEEITRKTIEKGITQVVNLGAGFDTLAWRLHSEYSKVNFIELDHHATHAQKSKALFDLPPANLHLLAIDFNQSDVRSTLESFSGFDATRPTLFICEGVLMYLNEKDVIRLFDAIKQLTGRDTHFIFSGIEPLESKNNNAGLLLKLYLKLKNEPPKWALAQSKLSSFLKKEAYSLLDIATSKELHFRYIDNIKRRNFHRGEYLVLAKTD